jgi:DNA-binding transcriptional regulator YiaG
MRLQRSINSFWDRLQLRHCTTAELSGFMRPPLESMRRGLNLNQHAFGNQLGVSPMTVSRWERGTAEPSGGVYLLIGKLAGDPIAGIFGDAQV